MSTNFYNILNSFAFYKKMVTFKRVHVYEEVNILAKHFSCIFT